MQFLEGSDSAIVEIVIFDDDLAEGVETFTGELVVTGHTQNFSTEIIVEIIDDERMLIIASSLGIFAVF